MSSVQVTEIARAAGAADAEISPVFPAGEKRARRTQPQPIAVLDLPNALLTIATVSAVTGLSASSLYRLAKSCELVPVKRGVRCTRWRAGDVTAYLCAQVASRSA